jgi:predicted O-methyltransferase YrrM
LVAKGVNAFSFSACVSIEAPPAMTAVKIPIRDIELCLWETLDEGPRSNDQLIYIYKDRAFLRRLEVVAERIQPKQMIEIGILDGGSTIYWQDRFQLERLIAFDIEPDAPHLRRYLERHDLGEIVRTNFAVAQDDGPTLRAAIAKDAVGPLVDLIVDDASHQHAQTRASVEILLPFLRPGGAYVIEDWAWGHHANWPAGLWADRPLMSPLLSELTLVCGRASGVIDRIEIDPNFAVLWRGAATLPKNGEFKLADHYVLRGLSSAPQIST